MHKCNIYKYYNVLLVDLVYGGVRCKRVMTSMFY